MLSPDFSIRNNDVSFYAIHRSCGAQLIVTSKFVNCDECKESWTPPLAKWLGEATVARVSGSISLGTKNSTVVIGWIASWLDVPMKEVEFDVRY